jgi:hypothetical protein
MEKPAGRVKLEAMARPPSHLSAHQSMGGRRRLHEGISETEMASCDQASAFSYPA